MKTFLPLLALVGLMMTLVGCSHTTKKYYEDDRRVDTHHDRNYDSDRQHDHDHH